MILPSQYLDSDAMYVQSLQVFNNTSLHFAKPLPPNVPWTPLYHRRQINFEKLQ